MTLRDRVAALEQRNAELTLAVRSSSSGPGQLDAEVQANLPRVTAISFDRLTGIVDFDVGALLRAYVEPTDGRGRFVQMTGRLTLKLVRVPAGEGEEAVTIAGHSFSPGEVRDAYRSGFMGTHYTFELPVELPDTAEGDSWLVLATFVDGVTGETLKAERAIELSR